ncbi:MFS transporter [Candidatus Peregrinibacteria bacterium]|jgi:MFS transporter, ACDE family, multidrug resistance protein|nr:MFS transporter [Candidatus Woesearchaeota archaeon]MBT4698165.1 MFS transporter [Candidatus Woesearchaeota archaeon]MBT4716354.1 MFS transporter [Candidatus Woesearchaeota archaeon]MBT7929818.1 MFS transporter [Candidatus Peregrinibacteria bacterium]MBT7930304.1 MFS transporter [Candidatus Woesearchaeota archaeon]
MHHGIIKSRHRKVHSIADMSAVNVITCIGVSLAFTFWAVFLKSFLHEDYLVGLATGVFTLVSLFAHFYFVPLVQKSDEAKLYVYCLISLMLGYLVYFITRNVWVFLLVTMGVIIARVLRRESFGILLRDNSSRKTIAKNEGFLYTMSNIGWVLGPLIAGLIAANYDVRHVYLFAGLFMFLAIIAFAFFKIEDKNHKKVKIDSSTWKTLKHLATHKYLRKAYLVSMGLNIWWAAVYIYMPLLIMKHLSAVWVGYFLFAIPIPMVMLEYMVGKYEKKFSARKFFVIGYAMLAVISVAAFFAPNIYWILGLFIFGSIAASLIEPTRESYFFELVPQKDEKSYYGPYMSSMEVGRLVGRFGFALVILFLPFNAIFIFLALAMLATSIISLKLKKV